MPKFHIKVDLHSVTLNGWVDRKEIVNLSVLFLRREHQIELRPDRTIWQQLTGAKQRIEWQNRDATGSVLIASPTKLKLVAATKNQARGASPAIFSDKNWTVSVQSGDASRKNNLARGVFNIAGFISDNSNTSWRQEPVALQLPAFRTAKRAGLSQPLDSVTLHFSLFYCRISKSKAVSSRRIPLMKQLPSRLRNLIEPANRPQLAPTPVPAGLELPSPRLSSYFERVYLSQSLEAWMRAVTDGHPEVEPADSDTRAMLVNFDVAFLVLRRYCGGDAISFSMLAKNPTLMQNFRLVFQDSSDDRQAAVAPRLDLTWDRASPDSALRMAQLLRQLKDHFCPPPAQTVADTQPSSLGFEVDDGWIFMPAEACKTCVVCDPNSYWACWFL